MNAAMTLACRHIVVRQAAHRRRGMGASAAMEVGYSEAAALWFGICWTTSGRGEDKEMGWCVVGHASGAGEQAGKGKEVDQMASAYVLRKREEEKDRKGSWIGRSWQFGLE